MNSQKRDGTSYLLLSLTFLFGFYSSLSSAETPEVVSLNRRIQSSLKNPAQSRQEINSVRAAYAKLNRQQISSEDLVELIFATSAWRNQLRQKGFHIDDLNGFGSSSAAESIAIPPTSQSSYGAQGWLDLPEASNYVMRGHTTYYQGLVLEPGDIFLTELMGEDAGAYSAIAEPRGQFSHAALFVVLKKGGRQIPAVMEIHEGGVRAVPLARFLSKDFSAYTEIYRPENRNEDFAEQLAMESGKLLSVPTSYDFMSTSVDETTRDKTAFTCTSLVQYLLLRAGSRLVVSPSRMNPQAHANLMLLGINVKTVLTPSDFMRAQVRFVGLVDNNQFALRLARAIVVGTPKLAGTFAGLMSQQTLDESQLSWSYGAVKGLAGHAKNSWDGRVIRKVFGFDSAATVPNGSAGILAFAYVTGPAVSDTVGTVVEAIGPILDGLGKSNFFSIHEFELETPVHEIILEANQSLKKWFLPSVN